MDVLNLVEKSKAFIRAFEKTDIQTMKSNWANDQPTYKMPYASGMFPEVAAGKDGFHEFTKDLPGMFENIELDIVEVILDQKARKVMARTEIKLHVKDVGPYENEQIFIFHFNE